MRASRSDKIFRPVLRVLVQAVLLLGLGVISPDAFFLRFADASEIRGAKATFKARFASLKSDRVNVRRGPNLDQKVLWVYRRAGLPVEVINAFGNWRQIRDSEGATGWVFRSLLSGRRTALVTPWKKKPGAGGGATVDQGGGILRARPDAEASVVAVAEPGVLLTLRSCDREWCNADVSDGTEGISGWIAKSALWGVYQTEKIDD